MAISTDEIQSNGNWIKNNLKTKDGIIMLLILLLIGVIFFLFIENKDLKLEAKNHQKAIDNLNKVHSEDIRNIRKECKQELLDWNNLVEEMSRQSKEKEYLSRKVVDLTKEKIAN